MFKEFKDFAMRDNVLDMAIGIIIGAAFGKIISAMVNGVLMPPIGLMLGGVDFADFFVNLSGGYYPTLAAAQEAGAVVVTYGVLINTIIDFLIVAFVIFLLIRQVNRFKKQEEAKPAAPPKQEVLLEEIRDLLRTRA
jgi:large conductance mechanosensitive channel